MNPALAISYGTVPYISLRKNIRDIPGRNSDEPCKLLSFNLYLCAYLIIIEGSGYPTQYHQPQSQQIVYPVQPQYSGYPQHGGYPDQPPPYSGPLPSQAVANPNQQEYQFKQPAYNPNAQ